MATYVHVAREAGDIRVVGRVLGKVAIQILIKHVERTDKIASFDQAL